MTYFLQPSERVDYMTYPDGVELTKLPYPFFVAANGNGRVGFEYVQVLGFQNDLAVNQVDLYWKEAIQDLDSCVGKYLVTQRDGLIYTEMTAIKTAKVIPDE